MPKHTQSKRNSTISFSVCLLILITLASVLSSCVSIIQTPVPTEATNLNAPTVQNPATAELTLVSPTEVVTELPTVTKAPEPTPTETPEPIKEIQPLTEYSDVRIPDSISFLETQGEYTILTAIGVISGFGTNETEHGILNDYILIDIGKGKFKVLSSSEFIFGAALLDGRCIRQNKLLHFTSNFEDILPYLAIGKGIGVRYSPNFNRDSLCYKIPRLGGISAFTDEECMNSLSEKSIGTDDLNYLNSVINGEVTTSEPVLLGLINLIYVSKLDK